MPDVRLDQIRAEDLEFLRQLRNAELRWFFDRTEVTPQAQRAWHAGLAAKPNHHWYMVRVDQRPAGCFFVKLDGAGNAEVGSILLAPQFRGLGVMHTAIGEAMARHGSHLRYFTEVLPDNDNSLNMFKRLGFQTRSVILERGAK